MKVRTGTIAGIAVAVVFLIFGAGVWIGAHVGFQECERKAMVVMKPYTWDLGTGCFIEMEPGKWVPLERL